MPWTERDKTNLVKAVEELDVEMGGGVTDWAIIAKSMERDGVDRTGTVTIH